MAKTKIIRLESENGENHFIIQECDFQPTSIRDGFSEIEAMKAAKKEAAKPLLLTRE